MVEWMSAIYPETMDLLAREFPADHAALLADIARVGAARGDRRAVSIVAFRQMSDVRRAYAEVLPQAPPVALSIMLGHLATLYEIVYATEGPDLCARLARDGSAVLFEAGLASKYGRALDLQTRAYFEAVLQARRSPAEPIEAATQEDWGTVLGVLAASGVPRSYLEAITSGEPAHPEICPALVRLLRAAGVLETPEGLRARADFAKNLTGY